MGNASLRVVFKDGTVLHGEYQGTVDAAKPKLFDTPEDCNTYWRKDHGPLVEALPEPSDAEAAECVADYADQNEWTVVASKSQKRILAYRSYYTNPDHLGQEEEKYSHLMK